ncbi:DUF1543 domain-containing protein [Ferruginibacter yonginensis]|uniref:DUF1543 domain-containing protein n=1 Tax=Ferruginibacter yonginensis TaxID=1310416 RepID=A0ABV8QVM6_9BACT
MSKKKLFMLLLGCRPKGRLTEQHDIFFGIAEHLHELAPAIKSSWKNASPIHVDAWRMVTKVNDFHIEIVERTENTTTQQHQLFFINLGGYKPGVFDEAHYKMLVAAANKNEAIAQAKQSAFYLHTGFGKDAKAHVDDKYGVDVDDIHDIKEILDEQFKTAYTIKITHQPQSALPEDDITLGYFPINNW